MKTETENCPPSETKSSGPWSGRQEGRNEREKEREEWKRAEWIEGEKSKKEIKPERLNIEIKMKKKNKKSNTWKNVLRKIERKR